MTAAGGNMKGAGLVTAEIACQNVSGSSFRFWVYTHPPPEASESGQTALLHLWNTVRIQYGYRRIVVTAELIFEIQLHAFRAIFSRSPVTHRLVEVVL